MEEKRCEDCNVEIRMSIWDIHVRSHERIIIQLKLKMAEGGNVVLTVKEVALSTITNKTIPISKITPISPYYNDDKYPIALDAHNLDSDD